MRGREAGRETARGLGRVGVAPPAPRGTRCTCGREGRVVGVVPEVLEEGVVAPLMVKAGVEALALRAEDELGRGSAEDDAEERDVEDDDE